MTKDSRSPVAETRTIDLRPADQDTPNSVDIEAARAQQAELLQSAAPNDPSYWLG